MNEGQQQWVHTTRSPVDLQQEMNVTGRLPHGASSENTAQIPNGIVYIHRCLLTSITAIQIYFKGALSQGFCCTKHLLFLKMFLEHWWEYNE